jgi:2-(1,2-epoxy-1,2-dihydrophenyl)acetyl-CoA isomerase
MSGERARLEHGAVLELVLASGARGNAIDRAAATELRELVAEIVALVSKQDGPRALLIRAEGPHFCVGGDLRDFSGRGPQTREHVGAAADEIHEAILALIELPVPLIVAVHGAVAGGGMGLALTGDVIVAASNARFRMAYTAVGLTPDCGTTWLLPRVVGRQRALDLTLTNRTLDATEALAWGLVSRVVDEQDLYVTALKLATDLASGASDALIAAKALLVAGAAEADPVVQLRREAASIAAAAATPEAQSRISAFLAR